MQVGRILFSSPGVFSTLLTSKSSSVFANMHACRKNSGSFYSTHQRLGMLGNNASLSFPFIPKRGVE